MLDTLRQLFILLLVVLICLGVWLIAVRGMRRSWADRADRQRDLLGELPAVPTSGGDLLAGPASGLFIGSTMAPDWQERVAAYGLSDRATALCSIRSDGILLERDGSAPLWIPRASLDSARIGQKLAGKVMPGSGILILRWSSPGAAGHPGTLIDTGFRADDKSFYPEALTALDPMVSSGHCASEKKAIDE